jgi:hypothetical protein
MSTVARRRILELGARAGCMGIERVRRSFEIQHMRLWGCELALERRSDARFDEDMPRTTPCDRRYRTVPDLTMYMRFLLQRHYTTAGSMNRGHDTPLRLVSSIHTTLHSGQGCARIRRKD